MRILEAIFLLFSRAAGKRSPLDGSAGAHATRSARPPHCRQAAHPHVTHAHAMHRHAPQASRTRQPFEIRRPERFGIGDVAPGPSNAPEAGGIKL
ncbi:hypothetical protein WS71_11580 [Burkholderia mayonis]|uniref:Uncharacterized protein n=2 Tax=Burkholderia mayonis TaxID=1385591 RepID=A0A1B4FX48_9BURK|nr:hypothetical protein WS71_11580 [Burkholderia mayonis]KVE50317.1 hypothetical protein WS71_13855 [Burkholderia mayonis]